MAYCLIPSLAEKFKLAMKSGEISPDKLNKLDDKGRQELFEKYMGKEDASNVNALFESKLLLKNQKRGMISWAKTVTGLKEPAKRDIFATIERLDKVLNPAEEKEFLNALANKRLGVEVTMDESKKIFDMAKQIEEAKKGMNDDGVTFKSDDARLKYGVAKTELNEYIKELKSSELSLTRENVLKNPIAAAKDIKERFKTNPIGTTAEAISQAAGTAKSLTSSMDNSSLFRQGWKTLMTNPNIWRKNAVKSFTDIWKSLGGENTLNGVYSDGFSRENNLNGYYKKAKLAVGVTEEAYPSSIPEKIPYYNKLYKASQNAYAGFLYRQRMDVFDKYIDIAKKNGVELTDKELSAIGNMVNSLTGRGSFGKFEGEAINLTNNIFFSPRLIKSHLDTLGGHVLTGGGGISGGSNFVRKEAAKNLVKIIGGTAAILATAKAINPESVELDPRSSDFGKIKIGNTRFDVTGGMGSVAVLAARLIRNSSKSSTTGKVTKLNSGKFGSKTRGDVIGQFAGNKLSPAAALIYHTLWKGTDFEGKKPTVAGEVKSLTLPIGFQSMSKDWKDPKAANFLLIMLANTLGIGTNTYGEDDFKKK